MCGIAGMSRARKTAIPKGRKLALELAYAIEDRGRHATGFAWEHDGWPYYWKSEGAASKVAHRAPLPMGREGEGRLDTLLVHTRYATKGDPSVDANNHPVIAPGLLLVHNGRVANDDDIIGAVGHERAGEVDSEALAALLALGPETMGAGHPTELLELVHGVAAIAWLDGSDPGSLHLARLRTRPLAIASSVRGDFLFASTPAALQRAAFRAEVRLQGRVEVVSEGTYLRVVGGRIVERKLFHPLPAPAEAAPADVHAYARPERKKGKLPPMVIDGVDWMTVAPRRGWKGYGG